MAKDSILEPVAVVLERDDVETAKNIMLAWDFVPYQLHQVRIMMVS